MPPELIGWSSAFVLLPTFGVQAYRQWASRDEPVGALMLWFFVLALIGTGGQVVYSWLVDNAVYLFLNVCLVACNAFGLGVAVYRRRAHPSPDDDGAEGDGRPA